MSSRHPDELLPWYVNGTLPQRQREDVAAHLAECKRCRKEVAFLEEIREGIREGSDGADAGEIGLRRLLREVEREEARKPTRSWWRPALGLAAAMIIGIQMVLLLNLEREPSDSFTPLSGAEKLGAVLQIRFNPAATEAQIRELLQSVNARLVDGPGAIGVYRLRLEGRDIDLRDVVAKLEARTDVVEQVSLE